MKSIHFNRAKGKGPSSCSKEKHVTGKKVKPIILRFYFAGLLVLFVSCFQYLQAQGDGTKKQPPAKVLPEDYINQIYALRNQDLQKAKQLCADVLFNKTSSDPLFAGRLWSVYGSLHWQEGLIEDGIYCHRMARKHYLQANDSARAAYALSDIGIYFYYTGKYDSVMHYYLQSVEELQATKDFTRLAIVYYNIGNYFVELKSPEKGRQYFTKGLAVARPIKDTSILINLLWGLGKLEAGEKNWKQAAPLLKEGYRYAEALDRKTLLGMIGVELSSVFMQLQQWDDALHFGERALGYALPLKEVSTYVQACILVSDAYAAKGQEAARIKVLKKALAAEKEVKGLLFAGGVYKWLADASYKLGNYKRAYELLSLVRNIGDSTERAEAARINAELETKYQAAQKEKELSQRKLQITQKEVQLQNTKQYFFFSVSIALVAVLAVTMLFLFYRYKSRFHYQQLKTLKQEKEIHLLQAVMQGEEKERSRIAKDLHDGVAGMLAATKMHVSSITSEFEDIEQNPGYRQAMQLLNEASHEVRKTAHNLMPEVLTRYGLDEALRRYCSSISNENKLKVDYDFLGIPLRFLSSFELSVYRIVQELLTNVLKHSNASEAIVQVSLQHDCLFITVEDNGIGILGQNAADDGMGLHSLRSRVQAMNGKMDLENNGQNGVSAYLEFDITEVKNETDLHYANKNTVGHY